MTTGHRAVIGDDNAAITLTVYSSAQPQPLAAFERTASCRTPASRLARAAARASPPRADFLAAGAAVLDKWRAAAAANSLANRIAVSGGSMRGGLEAAQAGRDVAGKPLGGHTSAAELPQSDDPVRRFIRLNSVIIAILRQRARKV